MASTATTRILEPCRGRRQIDRRAWSCLERCRRKLRLDAVPLPVPVEEWIEGPLQIRFGVSDLSHLGDGVLGAAFVEGREILIDERVLEHEGRCRFTCAHELGHLVLHSKVQSVFHETLQTIGPGSPPSHGSQPTLRSPSLYERQADRFAAAFLMPLPLLERELLRIFREHRMDRLECTIELMKPTPESEWLWRKRFLPAITRRFDVSLSAAIIRCSNIQPRITDACPLLPRKHADRLLRPAAVARHAADARPAEPDDAVADIQLIDGVPKRLDLFSLAGSQPLHGTQPTLGLETAG